MYWRPYGLYFKSSFGNGYRYLDRCGEFLLAAEAVGFMPGEATPTGGQLTLPEINLQVQLNSRELNVQQELVPNIGNFTESCEHLSKLAEKFFGPLDIQSFSFTGKWFHPSATEEEAKHATLFWKQKPQDELAKLLDMVPDALRVDYNFSSGKSDLHVAIYPIAFATVTKQHAGRGFLATRDFRKRVSRSEAAKFDNPAESSSYGLMMDAQFIELDPPPFDWEKERQRYLAREQLLVKHFNQ